jgi:hypothetical protein
MMDMLVGDLGNSVRKLRITNIATMRNFEVISNNVLNILHS